MTEKEKIMLFGYREKEKNNREGGLGGRMKTLEEIRKCHRVL